MQISNVVLRNINIGDEVKLDKDFDNNTLTQRHLFDSFFEESNYNVLNKLGNNMFVIQNQDDLIDVQTVFKERLEKKLISIYYYYFFNFLGVSRVKFPPKTSIKTKKISIPM